MYYVSSDLPISVGSLDSFRYLSHHGIKGQKWGVRRFQNLDGTRTALGKKRYTWFQDILGYDERDRRDAERANAARASSEVSTALRAKKEADEKASKTKDDILEATKRLDGYHRELRSGGFTFGKGTDLAINEINAWNNYTANPTQANLDAALEASELAETELEEEKELNEKIERGQEYVSFLTQKRSQEIKESIVTSNRYVSATAAEGRARMQLESANNAYNKTVLGLIEKGKRKIEQVISRFARKK